MGSGMNCGYACGIVGILKILTVLFTVVPSGIMFHATRNASYYTDDPPFTEYMCDFRGERIGSSPKSNPCPEKWMGVTALIIFVICCVVSLICLIILLLVKLNENGIFNQIDYIYHVVAGLAVILAGCLAISFGAMALAIHPCDYGKVTADDICVNTIRKYIYHPDLHLVSGVIGLIAGIIYIFTALKVKKD